MQKSKVPANSQNVASRPSFNYVINPHVSDPACFESPKGDHLTVSSQALTIQEILSRHTRGIRTPVDNSGYYDQDYDPLQLNGQNFNALDLSEKMDIMDAAAARVMDIKTRRRNEEKHAYDERLRKEGEKRAVVPPTTPTPPNPSA